MTFSISTVIACNTQIEAAGYKVNLLIQDE